MAYFFNKEEEGSATKNVRIEYLKRDKSGVTANVTMVSDSIAYKVKQCVSFSIEGIGTDATKYASNLKGNKLLLILKVGDMKKIEKPSRKELVYAIEDCLDDLIYSVITDRYIAINGNWNMLMVNNTPPTVIYVVNMPMKKNCLYFFMVK